MPAGEQISELGTKAASIKDISSRANMDHNCFTNYTR